MPWQRAIHSQRGQVHDESTTSYIRYHTTPKPFISPNFKVRGCQGFLCAVRVFLFSFNRGMVHWAVLDLFVGIWFQLRSRWHRFQNLRCQNGRNRYLKLYNVQMGSYQGITRWCSTESKQVNGQQGHDSQDSSTYTRDRERTRVETPIIYASSLLISSFLAFPSKSQ